MQEKALASFFSFGKAQHEKKCVVLKCPYNTVGTLTQHSSTMKKNAEKKPAEWGCKFLLTLNKPTLTSLLMSSPLRDTPCKVLAFKSAVEIGAKGNLHAHFYVVFERSLRKDTLINRYKKDGIEVDRITSGTEQTVINYIGNLDKETSKGCTILEEYTTIYGYIETTQGQRNDLSASDAVLWQIKDAIDAGASKKELYDNFFPYLVRYGNGLFEYYNFLSGRFDVKKPETSEKSNVYELRPEKDVKLILEEEIDDKSELDTNAVNE